MQRIDDWREAQIWRGRTVCCDGATGEVERETPSVSRAVRVCHLLQSRGA